MSLEKVIEGEIKLKDNICKLYGFYLGVLGSTNDLNIRHYVEPRFNAILKPDCEKCGWVCKK